MLESKNLAGRAVASTVAGKSAQGRYYQYRQNGEGKAKAVLKTIGHNAISSTSVRAAAAVGMAAVGIVGAGLTSDYIRNNPASAVANIYNRYRR